MTPSLSFAITTRGPAPRVRALLELVRPHVDEIVLAADRTGDPDVLDACGDLADRRLRFELRDSPARLVGWIHHQCTADWILRLDDDEVPSPALLEALPELMAERRLSAVSFHRRWLYGSLESWIDCPPWRTDYQPRLVRNVPGLWTFAGLVHTAGDRRGETRFVEQPIYHGDLVLTDLATRRRKAVRYESEAPGARWEGYPLNATYLPERFDGLTTAPVPREDRASLQAVLADGASAPPPTTAAAPIRDFDFEEVDRYNTTSRPTEAALHADLQWVSPPTELPAGMVIHHDVRVRNLGDALWRPGATPPAFVLCLRCRDTADGKLVLEHLEPFSETVWPGQETVLLVPVRTPAAPGIYGLELDVFHDGRVFGRGPRQHVSVFASSPPSPNGSLTALHEAASAARALDGSERRRGEYDAAAAALRATRRYRFVDALTRPPSRRPPDEEGA